jgi:hypothetical protein
LPAAGTSAAEQEVMGSRQIIQTAMEKERNFKLFMGMSSFPVLSLFLMTLAGAPPTTVIGGISFVTTRNAG